jgi:hypothetical protein
LFGRDELEMAPLYNVGVEARLTLQAVACPSRWWAQLATANGMPSSVFIRIAGEGLQCPVMSSACPTVLINDGTRFSQCQTADLSMHHHVEWKGRYR